MIQVNEAVAEVVAAGLRAGHEEQTPNMMKI